MKPQANLEERLRATKPTTQVPGELHGSIMDAVRQTQPTTTPSHAPSVWRSGAFSSGLSILVLLAFWGANLHQRAGLANRTARETLAAVAPVLEQGPNFFKNAPAQALEPLAEELTLVHQDFTNFVGYLVATVR